MMPETTTPRKSRVYDHLRSGRLSTGVYLVENDVSGDHYLVYRHTDGRWRAVDLEKDEVEARTKMELMRALEAQVA